ncbi:M23 family metallopeptidase [Chelatococcus sp. SYSU_G07232]|uniref:M23 family metallopeptidase n=1 Tax=Chelatococcus albus TaxID=3047466 RepID=A0ABT7AKI6_9HYPH|nr:M23 family metallopeptidase [Chelatococcus sp. SYSU_G07232]MDJ1159885.1 M23 family metallopeptidase [Chelatococcus sp. SYSU_G07232]
MMALSDRRRRVKPGRIAGFLLALAWTTGAAAGDPLLLRPPVTCEIGRDCFIQNYVDLDPSPSARDHMCGTLSQDGHDGTDFRLPTMAAQRAGVEVVAAADGRVLRQRDGVADTPVTDAGRSAVQGSECGNGLVIDHGNGWETQYCHLAEGSLRVKPGDAVKAGQPIGRVGLSGLTEYPHLHFTVRHDGRIVDPFAHEAPPGSCGAGSSLWGPAFRSGLAYQPRTILNQGFAPGPVTMQAVEADGARQGPVGAHGGALVAYVRAIGLKAGDVHSLTLKDPAGRTIAQNRVGPIERNQAQALLFAGRRRPAEGWRPGGYQASYEVTRDGEVVLERRFSVDMR